jgi:hypothetical protein
MCWSTCIEDDAAGAAGDDVALRDGAGRPAGQLNVSGAWYVGVPSPQSTVATNAAPEGERNRAFIERTAPVRAMRGAPS